MIDQGMSDDELDAVLRHIANQIPREIATEDLIDIFCSLAMSYCGGDRADAGSMLMVCVKDLLADDDRQAVKITEMQ